MMALRTGILTTDAPAPSPHLSQAIIHNGTVYCSGSFGMDPQTRELADGPYHQTVCPFPLINNQDESVF